MSAKFKPGDMVELLDRNKELCPYLDKGMIGVIICYDGECINRQLNFVVKNAWRVQFPHVQGTTECDETCLKLVPGNQDCREIGDWDLCPWNPYKEKTQEKIKVVESLKKNPFVDYDF
jgi:hypothetical protein